MGCGPLYTGAIDGVMGFGTLTAVKAVNNHDALIGRICDQRLNFLKHLNTWRVLGKGLGARVAEVRAIGQAWATGGTPQAANFVEGGQVIEDAKAAPSTAAPMLPLAPASVAVASPRPCRGFRITFRRSPLPANGITKIVVVLAVIIALLVASGVARRWYAKRKAARLAGALGTAIA